MLTELISPLIGVIIMVAPSVSDDHLENYSRETVMVKTMNDCQVVVESFNRSEVQVQLVENGPITTAYAWCKPVYGDPV